MSVMITTADGTHHHIKGDFADIMEMIVNAGTMHDGEPVPYIILEGCIHKRVMIVLANIISVEEW